MTLHSDPSKTAENQIWRLPVQDESDTVGVDRPPSRAGAVTARAPP